MDWSNERAVAECWRQPLQLEQLLYDFYGAPSDSNAIQRQRERALLSLRQLPDALESSLAMLRANAAPQQETGLSDRAEFFCVSVLEHWTCRSPSASSGCSLENVRLALEEYVLARLTQSNRMPAEFCGQQWCKVLVRIAMWDEQQQGGFFNLAFQLLSQSGVAAELGARLLLALCEEISSGRERVGAGRKRTLQLGLSAETPRIFELCAEALERVTSALPVNAQLAEMHLRILAAAVGSWQPGEQSRLPLKALALLARLNRETCAAGSSAEWGRQSLELTLAVLSKPWMGAGVVRDMLGLLSNLCQAVQTRTNQLVTGLDGADAADIDSDACDEDVVESNVDVQLARVIAAVFQAQLTRLELQSELELTDLLQVLWQWTGALSHSPRRLLRVFQVWRAVAARAMAALNEGDGQAVLVPLTTETSQLYQAVLGEVLALVFQQGKYDTNSARLRLLDEKPADGTDISERQAFTSDLVDIATVIVRAYPTEFLDGALQQCTALLQNVLQGGEYLDDTTKMLDAAFAIQLVSGLAQLLVERLESHVQPVGLFVELVVAVLNETPKVQGRNTAPLALAGLQALRFHVFWLEALHRESRGASNNECESPLSACQAPCDSLVHRVLETLLGYISPGQPLPLAHAAAQAFESLAVRLRPVLLADSAFYPQYLCSEFARSVAWLESQTGVVGSDEGDQASQGDQDVAEMALRALLRGVLYAFLPVSPVDESAAEKRQGFANLLQQTLFGPCASSGTPVEGLVRSCRVQQLLMDIANGEALAVRNLVVLALNPVLDETLQTVCGLFQAAKVDERLDSAAVAWLGSLRRSLFRQLSPTQGELFRGGVTQLFHRLVTPSIAEECTNCSKSRLVVQKMAFFVDLAQEVQQSLLVVRGQPTPLLAGLLQLVGPQFPEAALRRNARFGSEVLAQRYSLVAAILCSQWRLFVSPAGTGALLQDRMEPQVALPPADRVADLGLLLGVLFGGVQDASDPALIGLVVDHLARLDDQCNLFGHPTVQTHCDAVLCGATVQLLSARLVGRSQAAASQERHDGLLWRLVAKNPVAFRERWLVEFLNGILRPALAGAGPFNATERTLQLVSERLGRCGDSLDFTLQLGCVLDDIGTA